MTTKADPADGVFAASREGLAAHVESASCDACGEPQTVGDDGDGYGIPGSGFYLWTRGDSVILERVPLCCSCASAIGATALARWEIEEEEG